MSESAATAGGVRPAITLYGALISRPFRVLWMLHECGLDFEHVEVRPDSDPPDTNAPWYLALNPNARVPTLRDGDFVIWETAAINAYLAEKYGPRSWSVSAEAKGRALQWAFFMANDVEPALVRFRRYRYKRPAHEQVTSTAVALEEALHDRLRVIDRSLSPEGFLQGDSWGLADFMAASVLHALEEFHYEGYATMPRLRAWLDVSYARPAARKAIAAFRHRAELERTLA